MCITCVVQANIGLRHLFCYPGPLLACPPHPGTVSYHFSKGRVHFDGEQAFVDHLPEAPRYSQLGRHQNKTRVRRPPEKRLAVCIPREDPHGIGEQKAVFTEVPSHGQKAVFFSQFRIRKDQLFC
jgi:hypothetical protein